MDQPLLFLIKLAWACRYRLPILITIGFMALDVRMQLEIHVQMRRIRREPAIPFRGARRSREQILRSTRNSDDLDSSSSWSTIDEDDDDLADGSNEELEPNTSRHHNFERSLSLISREISQAHSNLLNVDLEN